MNKEQRVQYFDQLLKKDAYGSMEVYYKGRRQKLPVYEIDLDYLIYNQYNGRISSHVKSYEKEEGRSLDPTNSDDIREIEKFLNDASEKDNKNTFESLLHQGQLKYGIVTKDGVIIDGNRRALLLRKVAEQKNEKPIYFLGVVLEDELNDNVKEIMRLETTFQMGEDAKVDYDPIEKYLKCKDLVEYYPGEDGIKEIAKMMGEKPPKIKEYIQIMELMDEYLEKTGNSGIYTRLNKTEGVFFDLNGYITRYKGGKSRIIQWKYTDADVNDLKLIHFDYIRYMYNKTKNDPEDGVMGSGDSKDYRYIGQTSKRGSFFSSKELWDEFKDSHFESIDPIREKFEEGEYSVDNLRKEHKTEKLDQILKHRDETWARETTPHLKRILGQARFKLDLKNKQGEPLELLRRAKSTLESIDPNSRAFLEDPNVLDILKEINSIAWTFQQAIKHGPEN